MQREPTSFESDLEFIHGHLSLFFVDKASLQKALKNSPEIVCRVANLLRSRITGRLLSAEEFSERRRNCLLPVEQKRTLMPPAAGEFVNLAELVQNICREKEDSVENEVQFIPKDLGPKVLLEILPEFRLRTIPEGVCDCSHINSKTAEILHADDAWDLEEGYAFYDGHIVTADELYNYIVCTARCFCSAVASSGPDSSDECVGSWLAEMLVMRACVFTIDGARKNSYILPDMCYSENEDSFKSSVWVHVCRDYEEPSCDRAMFNFLFDLSVSQDGTLACIQHKWFGLCDDSEGCTCKGCAK